MLSARTKPSKSTTDNAANKTTSKTTSSKAPLKTAISTKEQNPAKSSSLKAPLKSSRTNLPRPGSNLARSNTTRPGTSLPRPGTSLSSRPSSGRPSLASPLSVRTSALQSPVSKPSSRLTSPLNDDQSEQQRLRQQMIQSTQTALTSPAALVSPRLAKSMAATTLLSPSARLLFSSPQNSSHGSLQRTRENSSSSTASPKSNLESLATRELPAAPKLTREQMNHMFEDWLKVAADNKINATNSWNYALIDYFSDLTLLRDGDSINFQKASCTLDGCVKIYTSRVDSVATETGKLLSGLSDKSVDGDDSQQLDEAAADAVKKRKTHRAGQTLEKNSQNLNVKQFDLTLNVDPLFRKTSAAFDEAGARGLLLGRLSVRADGKLIFDSNDAAGIDATEKNKKVDNPDTDSQVDVSRLIQKFLPNVKQLDERVICPTFAHYNMDNQTGGNTFQLPVILPSPNAPEPLLDAWLPVVEETVEQTNTLDNAAFIEEEAVMDEAGFDDDDLEHEAIVPSASTSANAPIQSPVHIWNQMAQMTEQNEAPLFSYVKSWSGPEHWKLRSSQALLMPRQAKKSAPTATSTVPTKKAIQVLDFRTCARVLPNQLFGKKGTVGGTASITLPRTQLSERAQQSHLLPRDYQFNGKMMMQLFTKPWRTLKETKQPKKPLFESKPLPEQAELVPAVVQEQETAFWASQDQESHEQGLFDLVHEESAEKDMEQDGFDGVDEDQDDFFDSSLSNNSQQVPSSAPTSSNPFLLNGLEVALDFTQDLVAQPRHTKAMKMHYAKTAKKVNVMQLKSHLWQLFTEEYRDKEVSFTGLVRKLDRFYSLEEREEISVSFSFICLLHLANEKGLVLRQSSLDEVWISV